MLKPILMKRIISLLMLAAAITSCSDKTVHKAMDAAGCNLITEYVASFNATDEELYIQEYDNSEAAQFLTDNVPYFECPDKELEKTYYFRWWTYRKHVKATPEGYIITEFLPEVGWAGKYNAINCPAMHQFSEGRWLRDPKYLLDYARHWCREKEDASKYSYPIAYSFLEFHKAHPCMELIAESYEDLKTIYHMWYPKRWDDEVKMFWQLDGYDGMEVSVSGGLNKDATGYRVTLNSYMYADAVALATIAQMLGKDEDVKYFQEEAAKMKSIVNDRLWDESARFYKVIPRHLDMSFSHAREQHGYVPWMFGIPDSDRNDAWLQLTDPQGFKAPYGPTTAEQRAEGFKVIYEGHACQWNGPSWPFATAQTLTALARTLHRDGEGAAVTKDMFFETLQTYSNCHRRVNEDGQKVCWIDENQDPFTGEWIARKMLIESGHQYKERGKDYNHSSFCDIVISGLIGVQPQLDGSIVIEPLLPEGEWDWFSLSRIPCAGKEVSVVYDKTGEKYGVKPGLTVYLDGKKVAHVNDYSTRIVI